LGIGREIERFSAASFCHSLMDKTEAFGHFVDRSESLETRRAFWKSHAAAWAARRSVGVIVAWMGRFFEVALLAILTRDLPIAGRKMLTAKTRRHEGSTKKK